MISKYINTIKELFNSPLNVIDSFLNGERKVYTHPFMFCVYGVIILLLLNSFFVNFTIEPEPIEMVADVEVEHLQEMSNWMQVAAVRAATQILPLMMILLFVPMLSLAGLFFLRKKITGFYHNLILNSYAVGASLVSLLILIPVWIYSGVPLTDAMMNTTIPAVLYSMIILWIYQNYLRPESGMDWIRIISSYVTGFVLFIFANNFLAGVAGYMIFAVIRIAELSGS